MSRRRAAASAALVTVAAVAAFSGCPKAAPEDTAEEPPGPVPVLCTPARAGDAVDAITLRGQVSAPPDRDAVVAPMVAGRVAEVHVQEGDRVRAGELLAVVENPALSAAVQELDAARAAARATLTNAEAAHDRAQRLYDQGIAPRRDIEDTDARRAAAAAELAAVETRRELALRQQAQARATAPIAGVVVRVFRRAGELVDGTPATPIVEIADTTALELRVDAPARDLMRVAEGAAADIALDALPGRALRGTVTFVSPAVDPVTSLGVVRASLGASGDAPVQAKIGLSGTLSLTVPGRRSVVLVPATAVRRSTAGAEEVVVCADEGGSAVARARTVTAIGRSGDLVEIESGLAAGERVVADRVLGLEDGAALAPREATPP